MKLASSRIVVWLLVIGFFSAITSATRAQVVGYWQFNEQAPGNNCSTNAGAILDASGNGHNGTATIPLPYVAGSSGYGSSSALDFNTNAAVDKVVVPDANIGAFNFSASQSVTIEAVIRARSAGQPSAAGNIISKQGAVAGAALPGEWYLRLLNAAGNLRFTCSDGTTKTATGTKSLIDGKWHHVAGVYDANAHQLRVYVDYVLDASATTTYTGTIGNTNDLCLGQQNNNGAKFDGDIDFIKFSDGALAPSNFVQASTSIANLSPANGSTFVAPTNQATFTIGSAVGVAATNITVTVNGSNITSQLTLAGNDSSRQVTLPALAANVLYNITITATDYNGFQAMQPWVFDTFSTNDFSFEGEDYNFNGGQYIDQPVLSSSDGPNNYLDQLGEQGIDFNQTNTPVYTQYRIGDLAGTKVCPDTLRPQYVNAQVTDPGVLDYMLEENADTEWVNYTRTFPAGTYRVYARLANPGTIPSVMQLDQVTAGSTTAAQTLAPIGFFKRTPTSSATDFEFAPLTDALGNPTAVSLSGVNTLRVTFVSAGANVLLNYLIFVPVTSPQVPTVAAVTPAAGAGNVVSNAPIQVAIRNADTSINTGTVQLLLDGSAVSPTVTPTGSGANISYTPAGLAIGWHTATLIFADSAATSVTNQWQFFTANQSVLGYWKFNEQTAGNPASTNAGAILDASGNARNGTVTGGTLQYAAGSFNYGNTPAMRFNGAAGYVDVPDTSGIFTFTNSFTMEAVIRSTNNTSTQGAILAKNGLTDGEGEYWWRFPGTAGGQQEVGLDGLFLTGTNVLNDGQWHHVAVVYNSTNNQVSLYADYMLEASATSSFASPIGRPTDLFLGSFINGGSFLNGDVDMIRISSGALTTNQFIVKTVALQPILKSTLPVNGANNVAPTAPLEAVFQNRDTFVAIGSLKLSVDGSDVTAHATTSTNGTATTQIDYTPATALAGGAHTATVLFQDTATPPNYWTNTWSFTTLATLPVLADWQFNEQAPGNAVSTNIGALIDSSGNGHNATVNTNGLFYVLGDTNYGGGTPALNFLVTPTNNLSVPDPGMLFNFLPTQSITMEAIISTTNAGPSSTGGDILAKQGANPGEWYWRITQTGTLRFSANDGTGLKTATGTRNLDDGQWHHIAAVYDGTLKQLRVYSDYAQDGAAVTTAFNAIIGNTNESLFIAAQQSGTAHFNGVIDEIRVSTAALDPSWFLQPGAYVAPPAVSLANATVSGGSVGFSFTTASNHSYIVQSTGDLTGTWTNVATIPGDGTLKTVSYPAAGAQQFFRIVAQ